MPQEALEGTSEGLSPLLQVKYASLISVALERLLALISPSRQNSFRDTSTPGARSHGYRKAVVGLFFRSEE